MAVKVTKDADSCPDWLAAACRHGLLSRLPLATVNDLVAMGHRVEYPRGAVILRWDDSSSTLIVIRGVLREFLADTEGRQITTRYLQPGDSVGLAPEFRPPVSRGLHVLEQCEVLVVSQRGITELSSTDIAFAAAVIDELSANLSSALASFYRRVFGTVRQRVIGAMLERASLTGGVTSGRRLPGTQHDLAMAVGSVREVVAAVLQELKREGMIEVRRGEVILLEPERLALDASVVQGWDGAGGAPSSSNIKSST